MVMDSPKDAALMARALGEVKGGEKQWEDMLGPVDGTQQSRAKQIDNNVLKNEDVQDFQRSLKMSQAPASAIQDIVHSLQTFARASAYYNQDADPIGSAVKALVTGKYQIMPMSTGGARIPHANVDAVLANEGDRLEKLDKSAIAIPDEFNHPERKGAVNPEDYIGAIRANPIWTTNQKGDGVELRDNQGHIVRDLKGNPLTIRWTDPAPTKPNWGSDLVSPGVGSQ
jgi:hypothetical protein